MHAATEVIGMMASLTSFLIWLPQGARVWKHRRDPAQLQGIVLSTQVISLTGTVLWGLYAILIDSFWLGAPALVNGPIAIATLVIVGRATRSSAVTTTPAVAGAAAFCAATGTPDKPAMSTVPPLPALPAVARVADVRELVAAA